MTERWVVNASPLIVLSRVGLGHLFTSLANKITVPRAVVHEINAGPQSDPARRLLAGDPFEIVETQTAMEIAAWDLGAGEAAVLSYALMTPDWTVVLDDGAARKCARSFNLPLKGTLAVVILAKQRGFIDSASDVLRMLLYNGFRLDDHVIAEALERTVGEAWEL